MLLSHWDLHVNPLAQDLFETPGDRLYCRCLHRDRHLNPPIGERIGIPVDEYNRGLPPSPRMADTHTREQNASLLDLEP